MVAGKARYQRPPDLPLVFGISGIPARCCADERHGWVRASSTAGVWSKAPSRSAMRLNACEADFLARLRRKLPNAESISRAGGNYVISSVTQAFYVYENHVYCPTEGALFYVCSLRQ
jgi:hypothetical protein